MKKFESWGWENIILPLILHWQIEPCLVRLERQNQDQSKIIRNEKVNKQSFKWNQKFLQNWNGGTSLRGVLDFVKMSTNRLLNKVGACAIRGGYSILRWIDNWLMGRELSRGINECNWWSVTKPVLWPQLLTL